MATDDDDDDRKGKESKCISKQSKATHRKTKDNPAKHSKAQQTKKQAKAQQSKGKQRKIKAKLQIKATQRTTKQIKGTIALFCFALLGSGR